MDAAVVDVAAPAGDAKAVAAAAAAAFAATCDVLAKFA